MKLYMVPLAPNPTKVMLYIAEREQTGQSLNIGQIVVNTVKGRHKEPAHIARNPFGTLPVLELDDGQYIIESLSIMEFLDEKFPDGGLIGQTPESRAANRDAERIVDLKFAVPAGVFFHATKSPLGYPPDAGKAAAAKQSMQPALDYLEGLLSDGRENLTGNQVSLADFTLQASLQLVRFINEDVLGERPALRAWDARYRERPAAKKVLQW